jgi:hypothetical protein
MVKFLLDHGAKPDYFMSGNYSVGYSLSTALVAKADIEIFKELINHGAKVFGNLLDLDSAPIFHLKSFFINNEVFKLFLNAKGFDEYCKDKEYRYNILITFKEVTKMDKTFKEIVDSLISKGFSKDEIFGHLITYGTLTAERLEFVIDYFGKEYLQDKIGKIYMMFFSEDDLSESFKVLMDNFESPFLRKLYENYLIFSRILTRNDEFVTLMNSLENWDGIIYTYDIDTDEYIKTTNILAISISKGYDIFVKVLKTLELLDGKKENFSLKELLNDKVRIINELDDFASRHYNSLDEVQRTCNRLIFSGFNPNGQVVPRNIDKFFSGGV